MYVPGLKPYVPSGRAHRDKQVGRPIHGAKLALGGAKGVWAEQRGCRKRGRVGGWVGGGARLDGVVSVGGAVHAEHVH